MTTLHGVRNEKVSLKKRQTQDTPEISQRSLRQDRQKVKMAEQVEKNEAIVKAVAEATRIAKSRQWWRHNQE